MILWDCIEHHYPYIQYGKDILSMANFYRRVKISSVEFLIILTADAKFDINWSMEWVNFGSDGEGIFLSAHFYSQTGPIFDEFAR